MDTTRKLYLLLLTAALSTLLILPALAQEPLIPLPDAPIALESSDVNSAKVRSIVEVPMYEVRTAGLSNEVGTDDVVVGNCGSTYLIVLDLTVPPVGTAGFMFGGYSQYKILTVNYTVFWVNNDNGQQGSSSGIKVINLNSQDWADTFQEITGYGLVEARLTGTAVVLKDGRSTICTFLVPQDRQRIAP